MTNLEILDFSVITRNMMDLGNPEVCFTPENITTSFSDITQTTERFKAVDEVSKKLCSLAQDDIIRLCLPTLSVLDHPKNSKEWPHLSEDEIRSEFASGEQNQLDLHLSLHHSGVLAVYNYLHYQGTISIQDAINHARVNLRTLIIKLPKSLSSQMQPSSKKDKHRVITTEDGVLFVGSLKDLSLSFLRPLFLARMKTKFSLEEPRDQGCHSSTLIQVYKTNPVCESLEEFVSPKKFGKEIRGLTCLDKGYKDRSEALIVDSLVNLSPDEESRVFTFGVSDIVLYDQNFEKMVEKTLQRKKYEDRYSAILHNTAQYSALLEWVHLEKYIIDLYNRTLSRAIAEKNNSPEKMLLIQKNSMHDLIGYKEGVTIFPCREEFWQKARAAHNIAEGQERLEKKRDLATDYVVQVYTLRTNRSIQSVNIFVSATAAFSLIELAMNIWDREQGQMTWSASTVGLFLMMLIVFWWINSASSKSCR